MFFNKTIQNVNMAPAQCRPIIKKDSKEYIWIYTFDGKFIPWIGKKKKKKKTSTMFKMFYISHLNEDDMFF